MATPSPEAWFYGLPPVSRYWFTSAVLLTVGTGLGMVNPSYLIFDLPLLTSRFQVRAGGGAGGGVWALEACGGRAGGRGGPGAHAQRVEDDKRRPAVPR
jgi:hypothetical protein